jgi:hypothetical protein
MTRTVVDEDQLRYAVAMTLAVVTRFVGGTEKRRRQLLTIAKDEALANRAVELIKRAMLRELVDRNASPRDYERLCRDIAALAEES